MNWRIIGKTGARLGFPMMRQFTGLTVRGPKNAGEKELDRMGFTRGNILPSTGNDQWDRTRAKHMGPLFERFINPFVESPQYQEMNDEERGVVMERLLSRVRRGATAMAAQEEPELYRETLGGRKSKRTQRLLARRRRDFEEQQARLEEQRKASQ